jgi:hypothetical protein
MIDADIIESTPISTSSEKASLSCAHQKEPRMGRSRDLWSLPVAMELVLLYIILYYYYSKKEASQKAGHAQNALLAMTSPPVT